MLVKKGHRMRLSFSISICNNYLKIVTVFLLFIINLTGCSVNPATGQQEFTPLLPASQEKQIGAEQHRNIVNEFGGIYKNQKLTDYVQKIFKKISQVSELPAHYFQIFILNTPDVNAFALPGGYVYVTRGLVALANTEAELAGVIGHEIGHVTARHAANRSNVEAISGIGSMLIGVLTGSQQIAQLAQMGGQGVAATYSRSQENEADMLGVRYLAKAGYTPYGQADFLRSLRIHSDFQKQQNKNNNSDTVPSFFATHPDTASRVTKAADLAREKNISKGFIGRQEHLKAITSMMWGDDPAQGIIKGQSFFHSDLKMSFSAPDNYRIINRPEAVYIQGEQNTLIKFDADFKASGQSPEDYLQYEFAKQTPISAVQSFKNNDFEGVTALTMMNTNNGQVKARLFAMRLSDTQYYRFIMSAPPYLFAEKERDFFQIAKSLKKMSSSQVNQVKPYTIQIKKINSSDSLENISQMIPDFNNKIYLLKMLNGLDMHEGLPKTGELKIISNNNNKQ
jgi:predicted Zn-dependent protease